MEQIEKQLEETILALANSFEKEAQENNRELINDLFKKYRENEDLYESEISLAYLNFTSFAAMPWLTDHPQVKGKNKSIIQFVYNGLFSHFIRSVIENKEGSCCSGDKERFVVKKVKEAVATGENISLYATYEGREEIPKEQWNEQTYWSPKSFKDTDDVIAQFWKWYNIL